LPLVNCRSASDWLGTKLDLVPGTSCGAVAPAVGRRTPAVGRPDASKQGSGSGARHQLWGGRMLANMGSGSGARHPLRLHRARHRVREKPVVQESSG
jgi:hypothetical protein